MQDTASYLISNNGVIMADLNEVRGRFSLANLAKEAMAVESAPNLLALSKRFGPAMEELKAALEDMGQSTSLPCLASHPIARVWTSAMVLLTGRSGSADGNQLVQMLRAGQNLQYCKISGVSPKSVDDVVRVFGIVSGDTVLLGSYPVGQQADLSSLLGLTVAEAQLALKRCVKKAAPEET